MIQTFDSNQARARWRDLLDAAQTLETDVVITRYNKPVVAMLAYEDYVAIREELQRQRARRAARRRREAESLNTVLASDQGLNQEWNCQDENEAWQDL